jgi:hypothetical protein
MVAFGPIGLEPRCGRKIDRTFLNTMPMFFVKLSVQPLKTCALKEAQSCIGKSVKSNAFVVGQEFNVVERQPQNPRKISTFDNRQRYLVPILRVSL